MRIDRFDVLVVEAGPAGSADALSALSARPGARVGIVDRARLPRDKVCGDGPTPQRCPPSRDWGSQTS